MAEPEFDEDLDELLDDEEQQQVGSAGEVEAPVVEAVEIRRMDANVLTQNELTEELEMRGLPFKGFFSDDARTLQAAFDAEYEECVVKEANERAARQARAAAQHRLKRKRLLHEQQIKEEEEAIEANPLLKTRVEMVRQNCTEPAARFVINSITARVLAQALWANTSLVTLDISRNDLDDLAGMRLGRMLKRNTALRKLEMASNRFGPKTSLAVADSLKTNTTLSLLSLESNPLCTNKHGVEDNSGIEKIAEMIEINTTLTSLNLWRADVNETAASVLIDGLAHNTSLVFMDLGGNHVTSRDQRRIAEFMERNMQLHRDHQAVAEAEAKHQAERDAEKSAAAEVERKKEEVNAWMEEQKRLRVEQRRKVYEDERQRRQKIQAEREEAARIAREAREAAEAAAAKKKGKKGKKK